MTLVLLLAAAVLTAVIGLLVLAHLLRSRRRARGEVAFQGGVNVDSGRLGTGSNAFRKDPYPTIVISSTLHPSGPRITVQELSTGQSFSFTADHPLTLGRGTFGSSEGGVLGIGTDLSISRQQFSLAPQQGQVFVQSISHTVCGQYNGVPLNQPAALHPGGVLSAGTAQLRITQIARP